MSFRPLAEAVAGIDAEQPGQPAASTAVILVPVHATAAVGAVGKRTGAGEGDERGERIPTHVAPASALSIRRSLEADEAGDAGPTSRGSACVEVSDDILVLVQYNGFFDTSRL